MTKPNPENCKNCLSESAYDCTTSVYNTTQNNSDYPLSYLQTNIIAHMLSIGEGVFRARPQILPLIYFKRGGAPRSGLQKSSAVEQVFKLSDHRWPA